MDDAPAATRPSAHVGSPSLSPEVLQAQVMAYARDLRTALARSRTAAEELARTHVETVAALAAAVDVRDEVTGGHVYRVANYGAILAEELAPELADDPQLIYGFLLHDIGKIAVPDAILRKTGPLTDDETAVMRGHVTFGIRFVKGVSFLRPALNIIATHHEAWDGGGYPRRLRGDEIPLGARMFVICDTFDAMTHDRPYRRGMPAEQALARLTAASGTQFDPDVVTAFHRVADRILAIEDRPGVPAVRMAARRVGASRVDTDAVLSSIDQPLVILDTDGIVTEANAAFTGLFGLAVPPVGMTLTEVVDRARLGSDPSLSLRRQMRQLEQDLFEGRREGVVDLADDGASRHLHWYSNLLRADGARVTGRLVVFSDRRPTVVSGDAFTEAASRDIRRTWPDLESARELLADPRPDDPAWRERAAAARRGISRIEGLLDRLEEDARQAADDGEDWDGLVG